MSIESARVYTSRMVERIVPLSEISPHPRNPNQHPLSQILQLKSSHETLGQFEPVVLWQRPRGYIQVKGHGYDEGVKLTRDTAVRAWILPEDTPEEFVIQIMLASNLHGHNSYNDDALLSTLLQEQRDAGYDLAALGTDEETLREMLASLGDGYVSSDKLPEEGDAETSEISERWGIVIDCKDEQEQLELLERFQEENISCRALVL